MIPEPLEKRAIFFQELYRYFERKNIPLISIIINKIACLYVSVTIVHFRFSWWQIRITRLQLYGDFYEATHKKRKKSTLESEKKEPAANKGVVAAKCDFKTKRSKNRERTSVYVFRQE